MGKADNIKRARKLKQAKRKREQNALIAAGLSPAGKTLMERNGRNGFKTIVNSGKIKYSELLKEFVQPIVTEEDDISIIKRKYTFGAYVWNAATVKEKNEEAYHLAKKDISKLIPGDMHIEVLFDEMVKRKQEEFSQYKNIIADFEIKKIDGPDYDLTVATLPLKDC